MPLLHEQAELAQKDRTELGVKRIVRARADLLCRACEHLDGLGIGFQLAIELQQSLNERLLRAQCAENVGQTVKIGALGVHLLHGVVHASAPQGQELGVIRHAKRGGEIGRFKMCAHQLQIKGVDGGDRCAAQQHELVGKMAARGVERKCVGQGLGDAGAQLPRGGSRKGHHQNARNVGGVLGVGEGLNDALGEHGGLSRARRGGDQQRALSLVDGGALRRSPIACHGLPPYLDFCAARQTVP